MKKIEIKDLKNNDIRTYNGQECIIKIDELGLLLPPKRGIILNDLFNYHMM